MTWDLRPQDGDTICAQATAPGMSSIAVLRVSGSQALNIVKKLCPFIPKQPQSHRVYFGSLSHQGRVIDQVLVLFFERGRSFTSEPVMEICCHGSPVVCAEILQALQEEGCRTADRGEFTYRAFLSGRIDLVQAESILHLIEARSPEAKRQALRHLKGSLSRILKDIQNSIQNLLAHIEADIDFSEENLSVISTQESLERVGKIEKQLKDLMKDYKQGQQIKEGLKVSIFGPPNSGKSTLLNKMLEEDKAIVSSIKGTTRDQVEGEKILQGQRIRLVDTAGIRQTKDPIEKQGVKKTFQTLVESDVCLYVLDVTSPEDVVFGMEKQNPWEEYQCSKQDIEQMKERVIFIFNKIDLQPQNQFLSYLKTNHTEMYKKMKQKKCFFISAQTGTGVKNVEEFLFERMKKGEGAVYLPRHYFCLERALAHIQNAENLLKNQAQQLELVSFELKEVLKYVQNILGKNIDMNILKQIFQQFCIGK